MTAAPPSDRAFAGLWESTRATLGRLGLRERAVPAEFADADHGRTRLAAACWAIGSPEAPVAECRIVRILGAASDIVNTMIFPHRPDRLPVFAAELLAFGGVPRLAFLDLQAPGLAAERAAKVGVVARVARAGFSELSSDVDAPAWAVAFSPGGFLFARPNRPDAGPQLVRAYNAYLAAWLALADRPATGAPEAGAAQELRRYQREHITHSPGRAFLGKLFGEVWAERFLNDFLYAEVTI
jgi:hypothetical protein